MKRYTLFLNNSEFTRNLWTRTIKLKFILQALFLVLIYFSLTRNIDDNQRFTIGATMFVVITIMMGASAVNKSLLQEFRDGTWDYQRLSGISAYKMMIGKLFGASFNEWILGLFAMGLSIIPSKGYASNAIEQNITLFFVLCFFAIFIHAATLILALIQWQRNDQRYSKVISHGSYFTFLVLLLVIFFGGGFIKAIFSSPNSSVLLLGIISLTSAQYIIVLSAISAAWAVLALYLRLRAEFNYPIHPIYWFSFIIFCWIFFGTSQFSNIPQQLDFTLFGTYLGVLGQLYIWIIFSCYALLIILLPKPKYWLQLTRIIQFKSYAKLINYIPAWLISYLFILILPILLIIYYPTGKQSLLITAVQFLSLTLFITRDLLIILYLSFTRTRDSTLLVFLIIYFAIPSFFPLVLSGLFFPLITQPNSILEIVISVLSPTIQIGIIIYLFCSQWERFIPNFKES